MRSIVTSVYSVSHTSSNNHYSLHYHYTSAQPSPHYSLTTFPVFVAHGFSFSWSGGVEGEGVVDGLCSIPWSKDKQFGVSDVHELLELVGDGVRAVPVLPKLLSVFASRACRSAVMIGDAMDEASMSAIVRHMSEMDHPWACPHGRPTMRHLCDLTLLNET